MKLLFLTALASLLALPLETLGKEGCEPAFSKIPGANPAMRNFIGRESLSSLKADRAYSTFSANQECCKYIAFTDRLLSKVLQNPHHSNLTPKFLAALAKGPVPPTGNTGLVRLQNGAWEVKILGKGGDLRLLGCESEGGKIVFSYFASSHADAKAFIWNGSCR